MNWKEVIAYEILGLPKPITCDTIALTNCNNNLSNAEQQNEAQLMSIDSLLETINDLERQVDETNEPTYYSAKKKITHFWVSPKGKSIPIPVQNFVQPHLVELSEIAKKKRLYLTIDKDYDKTVVKAYKASLLLDYTLDSSQFSMTERWLTAQEAIALGKDDCEGAAVVICSMLEHIGVPIDSVYAVWGLTYNGNGHCVVTVKDSTGIWRLLNTSQLFEKAIDLKDYPEFNKEDKTYKTNGYNLKNVDGGFNSIVSFNNFDYPKNLDSFLVKTPTPTQASEDQTYFKAKVVQFTNGITPIVNPLVDIEGRVYQGNAAGVIDIQIPNSLIGDPVKIEISKASYKTWNTVVVFLKGKTTSRLIKLIKGTN